MTEEKLKKSYELKQSIDDIQKILIELSKVGEMEIFIFDTNSNINCWISKYISILPSIKQLIIEDLTVQIEVLKTQFKEL